MFFGKSLKTNKKRYCSHTDSYQTDWRAVSHATLRQSPAYLLSII